MPKQPRPAGDAITINLANNTPFPAGRGCVVGVSFYTMTFLEHMQQAHPGKNNNDVSSVALLMEEAQKYADKKNERIDDAVSLLKEYEQWEADIINEDKLWQPSRAKDVLRGKIYDTMMELQEKRNDFLARF